MSEGNVAADQLRLFIERIQRLEEEKRGITDDIKDVFLEAKAQGYDPKIMRQILRLLKMAPHDRKEMEAILDTYKAALGMDDLFAGHDGRAAGRHEEQGEKDEGHSARAPSFNSVPQDYYHAVNLVLQHRNASTSWLQRQLRIGYHQAARLIEQMEREGIVSAPDHGGRRTIAEVVE